MQSLSIHGMFPWVPFFLTGVYYNEEKMTFLGFFINLYCSLLAALVAVWRKLMQ